MIKTHLLVEITKSKSARAVTRKRLFKRPQCPIKNLQCKVWSLIVDCKQIWANRATVWYRASSSPIFRVAAAV
jgi:hypothetical protein